MRSRTWCWARAATSRPDCGLSRIRRRCSAPILCSRWPHVGRPAVGGRAKVPSKASSGCDLGPCSRDRRARRAEQSVFRGRCTEVGDRGLALFAGLAGHAGPAAPSQRKEDVMAHAAADSATTGQAGLSLSSAAYWPMGLVEAFALRMAGHGHSISVSMMVADRHYAIDQLEHAPPWPTSICMAWRWNCFATTSACHCAEARRGLVPRPVASRSVHRPADSLRAFARASAASMMARLRRASALCASSAPCVCAARSASLARALA